ncbi:glycosyl transferase family 90 [Kaistia dalseonensis]|uniref:Glycosyl transferase CAP10 domain-containing protein n=1 Tax=Kaistia dalseonensis TaxID=410840 RepID=A0ABU0H463_9HYPH|nr:glycosyl transferase family 90 [Kaistia dalseonensis]MCX5493994.1 glycosyl transferase family 90 [Kaistia dalseonensis]MDQ0436570.1 hypothetical protein [Kaistia dalseonensis]
MNPVEPALFSLVPRPLKEEVLLWRLGDALPTMAETTLRLSFAHGAERSRHRYQVDFERVGDRLIVILDRQRLAHDLPLYQMMWRRLPTFVRLLSRAAPNLPPVATNISDGGGNQPNELAFCSDEERAILVPDPAFMTPSIYEPFRELADSRPDRWNKREDTLLWRGAVTGQGHTTTAAMDMDDPSLKQRVRLCLALRGLSDVDVKLVVTGHDRGAHQATDALRAHGILGEFVPPSRWIDVKFAIDIDGSSNSWANLYTRLLLGCCVLKVASPGGFRQWYYDEFVPWTHYVPVASDLSDIVEKVEWCRAHDQACREIAAAGQEFALRRTPESETVAAVQKINDLLAGT